jgi:hypothetical protein
MNSLPLRWKLFRILCILQMLMIVYPLVYYVVSLFNGHFLLALIHITSYLLILFFLFLGLSLLNDNYPDTPFSPVQKRRYNRLFILNFLLIAFLFSKVVGEWSVLPLLFAAGYAWDSMLLLVWFNAITIIGAFVVHLLFLYGMYRLRVRIQNNTVDTWYQQFDQESPKQ